MNATRPRTVSPSHSELLEHATFLRRFAARLVGPDGADGRGRLEPLSGTSFLWSTTTPDEDGEPETRSEEEQGPGLELELPERVTTLVLSGVEVETTRLEFAELIPGETPVVILTPRE
jgi:hypothetical protein